MEKSSELTLNKMEVNIITHEGLKSNSLRDEIKISQLGAGGIVQQLRELAALTEDLCLVPTTHPYHSSQPSVIQIPGDLLCPSDL